MSRVAVRLGVFTVLLAGTFGAAYAVGEALPGDGHSNDDSSQAHEHMEMSATPVQAGSVSGGYQLVTDHAMAGMPATFHLNDSAGAPVTEFTEAHGALLHAIVVRPDLSGFQHLHPQIADNGAWVVPVPGTGQWHFVFEATPAGAAEPVIVTADVADGESVAAVPLPDPDDSVEVDGLVVTRNGFTFTVTALDGGEATGLQPYLGQPAHLVALRQGDLAFTHLHPGDGPAGRFTFEPGVTEPGTYRLFLQFGHDDEVLTVPFTVEIA